MAFKELHYGEKKAIGHNFKPIGKLRIK